MTTEKIMIAKLPVFGGRKNESFNNFVRQIEMQIETDANETTKMNILLLRLHEVAAEKFIEKASQNPTITFADMKAEMRKTFPEPLINSLQMIRRRKQLPQESLEMYADSVKILVNRFYTNDRGYNKTSRDFHMIKHFVYNVRQPIKQQLKKSLAKFKDLNDVLSKAIELQQHYHSIQVPQMTAQMSQLQIREQTNQQHMHQHNNVHQMQQRHYDPYSRERQQYMNHKKRQHCRGRQWK